MRRIIFTIFLIISITFSLLPIIPSPSPVHAHSNENKPYDYYVTLHADYGINARIHFRRYGIQKIFEVPEIKIDVVGKEKILIYRTEFHNGTENGCLQVFNKVEKGKIIPFFVLEELFYISLNHYYQRIVRRASSNRIQFDLYEIRQEDKKKMLTVELKKVDEHDFKIDSLIEFHKGLSESSLFFSDVFESLKKKILSGSY